jgi:signal transduction histidine kinase
MNNMATHKKKRLSVKPAACSHGALLHVLYKGLRLTGLILVPVFFLCGDISSAANGGRTVRVGVYENAPKIFTSESGKPAGIFIDIIENIAKDEGWNLQYVSGTWSVQLDRLEKGEIDLMPDVAYSAEREKRFSYHKVPVLSSWYQVYAPRGSNIRSILDLKEKSILVLEASVQQEAFIKLNKGFGLNSILIPVPDYKTMFEKVSRGEADAAITNRFYGIMHAKRYNIEDTAVIFEPSDLFFAASRGDPGSLLDIIDNHLSTLKKDPQSVYHRSLKRWTSEDAGFTIPFWLKILGTAMGIIIILSLTGSVVLKKQVNMRTSELRQINRDMEQRIIERTAELAVARDRAEAADRIKSAFLATMSHELRTPLNSIIGFTGVILQGLAGPLNDEQKKQIGMVKGSAQHLLSLINDILDISKIEAGQFQVISETFNLRETIEKAVATLKPAAEKKHITLKFKIGDEINEINSDHRRVEQVLLNLLSNAVKFTEQGSVSLIAETIPEYRPRDSGSGIKPSAAVRITIIDTGIGIPDEQMSELFQPFHQVDTGLSRKNEGTGLGLAICRRLAELLGGEIIAESELGQGSIFTFIIPLEKREIL